MTHTKGADLSITARCLGTSKLWERLVTRVCRGSRRLVVHRSLKWLWEVRLVHHLEIRSWWRWELTPLLAIVLQNNLRIKCSWRKFSLLKVKEAQIIFWIAKCRHRLISIPPVTSAALNHHLWSQPTLQKHLIRSSIHPMTNCRFHLWIRRAARSCRIISSQ